MIRNFQKPNLRFHSGVLTLILAFTVFLSAGSVRVRADITVVASIKPVHSLVAGVMAGTGKPYLIVKGSASPHTYALKPSDARALQAANIIFQIDPSMEVFLQKPIQSMAETAIIISLLDNPVLEKLKFRGKPKAAVKQDNHAHGHGLIDKHIWLDPQNAILMVKQISAVLSKADPHNQKLYQQNAQTINASLAALIDEINIKLAPVKSRPFIVFHDAYQYFEHRFGLKSVAVVTLNPEVQPGARRLREIRKTIMKHKAVCVFAEPQFRSSHIRLVTSGTSARASLLDPLGAQIDDGSSLYFTMLRNMAASIRNCLNR